jgi:hypothetical protein
MQSLVRAIKRGNAVIAYNPITLEYRTVYRKGIPKNLWLYALRESLVNATNIDDYLKERKK